MVPMGGRELGAKKNKKKKKRKKENPLRQLRRRKTEHGSQAKKKEFIFVTLNGLLS